MSDLGPVDLPDFYHPDEEDDPFLVAGRHRFFEAIANKMPEVVIELRDHVDRRARNEFRAIPILRDPDQVILDVVHRMRAPSILGHPLIVDQTCWKPTA